jgi:asparagine synthase (glutamine-hydrolysing)
MCGICGIIGFRDRALLAQMAGAMTHRGPDAQGFFEDEGVALGHKRLSIIDLRTGSQPMFNEDRSLCLVFNGEIYNYLELREGLEKRGHYFATSSDTEVILHAYEEKAEQCLEDFNGEFAFALWDSKSRRLFLARDRLGIRPLYYCLRGNCLAFASELQALLHWDRAAGPLSGLALDCYLTLRYVPASVSMIEGIDKLGPGCFLLFEQGRAAVSRYWTPEPRNLKGYADQDLVAEFRELFTDAVRLRMRSDVPVGGYLSGGIDSASIAAIMQSMTPLPVRTFTIGGFGEKADERTEAAKLARLLGTEHHELSIRNENYELLPEIVGFFGSPIGDAIVLPTFLLGRATSREVKVVLSGEGADEILAGYVHHLALFSGHALEQLMPRFLLKLGRAGCRLLPTPVLDTMFPYPASLGHKGKRKLIEYLDALITGDRGRQYLNLACLFSIPEKDELYGADWPHRAPGESYLLSLLQENLAANDQFLYNLIRFDLNNWLVDYTLAKQDAMTMANSLEARVPYLDHRLVEFTLGLPDRLKIRRLTNKVILRQAMRGLLPESTRMAPKKAFYLPTEKCFGPGFDTFVREVLLSKRFRERGIFNQSFLERFLERGPSEELVENKQIMALLLLELWMRAHLDKSI